MPHAKPYPLARDIPLEVVEKFWASVSIGEPLECWPWRRGLDGKGYGAFAYGGRVLIAPRLAYVLFNGSVPLELSVRHDCDNPPCCNPAHLILGTHLENMADREQRGRMPHYRGAENRRARLTAEQADEARALAAEGWTATALGQRYGISQSSMSRMLRGESYKSVA